MHRGSRPSSRLAATASRSGSAPGARATSGAELREYQSAGDVYRVGYEVDGQRHVSTVVSKKDLSVQVAGICLSGEDENFDLQSLVGVIREAHGWSGWFASGTRIAACRRGNIGTCIRGLSPVVEQCWTLLGNRRGRIWFCRRVRSSSSGERASVRVRWCVGHESRRKAWRCRRLPAHPSGWPGGAQQPRRAYHAAWCGPLASRFYA